MRLGRQNDGSGHYWCVLANTPHGRIPGKVGQITLPCNTLLKVKVKVLELANGWIVLQAQKGRAWYPYGGREEETTNFDHINVNPGYNVHLEKSR